MPASTEARKKAGTIRPGTVTGATASSAPTPRRPRTSVPGWAIAIYIAVITGPRLKADMTRKIPTLLAATIAIIIAITTTTIATTIGIKIAIDVGDATGIYMA